MIPDVQFLITKALMFPAQRMTSSFSQIADTVFRIKTPTKAIFSYVSLRIMRRLDLYKNCKKKFK